MLQPLPPILPQKRHPPIQPPLHGLQPRRHRTVDISKLHAILPRIYSIRPPSSVHLLPAGQWHRAAAADFESSMGHVRWWRVEEPDSVSGLCGPGERGELYDAED
jgi:hypothetical protein